MIFTALSGTSIITGISKSEKRLTRVKVAGITGVEETYFIHKLNLKVGGHLFKDVEIGFLEQIGQYGYGVVGQKGFFDIFVVKFDLKKEVIELKPR